MADNFFGFNTTFGASGLEDGLDDCLLDDEEYGEEEKYDALNDETFGSEATIGDWEQDHEKLAELTESRRPQNQNQNTANVNNKSFLQQNGPDLDIDVEDNLSHLVLDEKGITSRPGVWDSPTLSSLTPSRPTPLPKPPLVSTLKNACTVEEIERGLIGKRNDLFHQQQQQQHQNVDRQNQAHIQQQLPLNGLPMPPQRFPLPGLPPHSPSLPPNIRLPHAPFLPKFCLPTNQSGNMLRYPIPPSLLLAHGVPRQPFHNNFPVGNFHNMKQQNNTNMVGLPFIRPERSMLPFFANNMPGHQHPPHPNFGMNQRNNGQNRHQNDQPFFKNNQHYHMHNRGYNHHKDINGMNQHNFGDKYDEYAGLMSSREKQWLVNIQLLQLNTNQPYIDDYYYTVFCDRQNKKHENKNQQDKKQNNNGYHKDSRDQPTFTRIAYVPAQFENSLGKLQYSSVTAPRKIIDMDIVSNNEKQEVLPPPPKDTKKTRQLLLEIERLYILQLKLEDINNPLALLSEQQQLQAQQALQQSQQQETEPEPKEPKKTVPELCNLILTSLLQLIKDDKFISLLSIRKGKTLLLRFLPYLSVTEYTNQLQELWTNLLRGLAIIGRRDSNLLTNFYGEFRRWLQTTERFSILLCLAKAFVESSNLSSKINSLNFALTNKFGLSVLASMLEQAEEIYPNDEEQRREWSLFIIGMVDACSSKMPNVAPCEPIAANTLHQHLSRMHNLTLDRFEPLENLLTDANPAR